MDNYDHLEAEYKHSECTARTRASIYLMDLVERDDRFRELLLAHAREQGHPEDDGSGALIDICHHIFMTAMKQDMVKALEGVRDLLLGERVVQEALKETKGGDPRNN